MSQPIVVNIRRDAPPVSRAGFGTVLVLGSDVDFDERIRFYSSAAEILEDADADLSDTDPQYIEAAAAFGATLRPQRVALGRIANAETHAQALTAIEAQSSDWYGLVTVSRAKADILSAAGWVQTNGAKLFIAQTADAAVITAVDPQDKDVGAQLFEAGYTRTALLYKTLREVDATPVQDPACTVWAADRLSVDPDAITTTWAYVQLPGIVQDRPPSTAQTQLNLRNANWYAGNSLPLGTRPGKMVNGSHIDTLITADWSRFRLEEDLAQVFADASARGTKVPYTDEGIAIIESTFRSRIDGAGVSAGHFVEGLTEYDFPPRDETTAQDRAARLYRCSAEATLAGAIERVVFDFYQTI